MMKMQVRAIARHGQSMCHLSYVLGSNKVCPQQGCDANVKPHTFGGHFPDPRIFPILEKSKKRKLVVEDDDSDE